MQQVRAGVVQKTVGRGEVGSGENQIRSVGSGKGRENGQVRREFGAVRVESVGSGWNKVWSGENRVRRCSGWERLGLEEGLVGRGSGRFQIGLG